MYSFSNVISVGQSGNLIWPDWQHPTMLSLSGHSVYNLNVNILWFCLLAVSHAYGESILSV